MIRSRLDSMRQPRALLPTYEDDDPKNLIKNRSLSGVVKPIGGAILFIIMFGFVMYALASWLAGTGQTTSASKVLATKRLQNGWAGALNEAVEQGKAGNSRDPEQGAAYCSC